MKTEKQIMELLWDLFNKMMWLNQNSLKRELSGYKPSEIHCLDYIGTHAEPNATQLADAFFKTHEKLHHGFDERDRPVFEQLSEKEMDAILCFAKAYNEHLDDEILKMGLDRKSAGIDKL